MTALLRSLWLLAVAILALLPLGFPAQAAWAVAYSDGGKPVVVGGPNRSAAVAKKESIRICTQRFGGACNVVISGNNNCGAIANTYKDGEPDARVKWGFGTDRTRDLAGRIAVAQCQSMRAGACKVVHAFCGP